MYRRCTCLAHRSEKREDKQAFVSEFDMPEFIMLEVDFSQWNTPGF